MNILKTLGLFVVTIMALQPGYAFAYIGPGAGAGAIILTIALFVGVLLLFFGLVWYPLKRMLKGKKRKAEVVENSDTSA